MGSSLLKSFSILGVALALALCASPAAAAGKGKKKDSDEPKSMDELMEESAAAQTQSSDPEGGDTATEPEEEAFEEPDAWERPPVEEEKPRAAPAAAPVDEPVGDGKPLMVGLTLGYGFKTDRATGGLGADPYGFVFGVRGGYTLDFALYLGAFFNYYLGSSDSGSVARVVGAGEVSANYMQFGAEAGYDVWAGPIIFRPSLQIGLAVAQAESTIGTISSKSVTDVMFAPGAWIVYPMDDFFLGGDARINLVAGDGVAAVTLSANGGMRF